MFEDVVTMEVQLLLVAELVVRRLQGRDGPGGKGAIPADRALRRPHREPKAPEAQPLCEAHGKREEGAAVEADTFGGLEPGLLIAAGPVVDSPASVAAGIFVDSPPGRATGLSETLRAGLEFQNLAFGGVCRGDGRNS